MGFNVSTIYRLFNPYLNTNSKVNTQSIDKAFNGRYTNAMMDNYSDIDDTSVIVDVIAKVYLDTINTRSDLYDLINEIKDIDIAQYIIESVIDDAFNSVDTDEPFMIRYKGNKHDAEIIQPLIDEFVKDFDIYQLFWDIIDDFIIYGEYYLETIVEDGKGIVQINDTVDSRNVFSLYKNYRLLEHIGFANTTAFAGTRYNAATSEPIRIHKDLLSNFVLDARKVRINLTDDISISSLPDIIRVGRSILYPAIKLLKRSNILDTAMLAKELRAALMPLILSVSMPNVATPMDAIAAAKKFEKYFTDNAGLTQLANDGDVSISTIFSKTGKIKVAPTFQGGKAEIAKMDINTDIENIQSVKDNTDQRINDVIGLPRQGENMTRFEILKTKSRYSKKLIDLQRCTSKGFRQMIVKHLKYKHIYVDEHNIECKFKNILNADVFEEAEGMIAMMSVMTDLNTFIQSIVDNENLGVGVHPDALIKTFDQLLGSRYVTLKQMLYVKEKPSGTALTTSR